MDELKPCPFCGAAPVLHDHRLRWVVRCTCGACMLGDEAPEPETDMPESHWERYKKSAVDRWNGRAS